jgi:parvulin-like peptidyl-prolyl isomerase
MKGGLGAALLVWALSGIVSCDDDDAKTSHAEPTEERAALGGSVAARVAKEPIALAVVERVAAEQAISPRDALKALIDDAVAAQVARERGLDRGARWQLTAARARFTADRLRADARAKGPPNAEEIETLSKLYWREVDRPPTVRVIHALVTRPKDGVADPGARAHAETLRAALVGTTSKEEFEAKAKAFPSPPGLSVVVEELPAFAADGGVTEGAGQLVLPFARAAHALAEPGQTSGAVETEFGFHVIRLLEKIPEQRMPLETRRIAFTEEAHRMRAEQALAERLSALRARTPVSVSPAAEELMRGVHGRAEGEPSP